MKNNLKKLSIVLLSISSLFLFSASSSDYGDDVDECQSDPCPSGYICLNIPGGFICQNPETGEMTVMKGGYIVHKNPCTYHSKIDAEGYITVFGKKLFVGISTTMEWEETYDDAQIDCEMGGTYLCKTVTCKDFWEALNK